MLKVQEVCNIYLQTLYKCRTNMTNFKHLFFVRLGQMPWPYHHFADHQGKLEVSSSTLSSIHSSIQALKDL